MLETSRQTQLHPSSTTNLAVSKKQSISHHNLSQMTIVPSHQGYAKIHAPQTKIKSKGLQIPKAAKQTFMSKNQSLKSPKQVYIDNKRKMDPVTLYQSMQIERYK